MNMLKPTNIPIVAQILAVSAHAEAVAQEQRLDIPKHAYL